MDQGRVLAHPLSSDAEKRDALQQLLDHGLPAEVPTGQSSWPALLDEVEKASSCPIVGELAAQVRRAVADKKCSAPARRARKRRRIDAEAVGDEQGIISMPGSSSLLSKAGGVAKSGGSCTCAEPNRGLIWRQNRLRAAPFLKQIKRFGQDGVG